MVSVLQNEKGHAYNELSEELCKRRPNLFKVADICFKDSSLINSELRPRLYCSLLRLEKSHIQQSSDLLLKKQLLTAEKDLENQRIICADCKRTNSTDNYFKLDTTRQLMENILTYYCKRRSIKYMQGLNFVLAPFLKMLDNADDKKHDVIGPGAIFELYYAFVNKVLPNIYVDENFKSLQHSFKVFRLLLLYHDPQVCMVLIKMILYRSCMQLHGLLLVLVEICH